LGHSEAVFKKGQTAKLIIPNPQGALEN
jgi:hypothetical protein